MGTTQMVRNRNARNQGFTLIELLMVVGIIAILAALALPNFLAAQTRAKVARVRADLRTIATAMEAYAVDNNRYPPDWDAGIYPGITVFNDEYLTYANLTTPIGYITTTPKDPFLVQSGLPGFFEYYQEDAVIVRNATSWANTWTDQGMKWFAYSQGPDRINDFLAQDQTLAKVRTYDPTNGTISSGDIGRSNLGEAK